MDAPFKESRREEREKQRLRDLLGKPESRREESEVEALAVEIARRRPSEPKKVKKAGSED